MTETKPSLDWWEVKDDRDFIVGRVSTFQGMGEGWNRVVDLARDAAAFPHQTSSADRLRLECREIADLLVHIVAEDGHSLTLAECLRTIVIDVAQRLDEPHITSKTDPIPNGDTR